MNTTNKNNPMRPGTNPVCYFVAYKVFLSGRPKVVAEGNKVFCTSESIDQMTESVLRQLKLSQESYTLMFTSLTVLTPEVAHQLIFGCNINDNDNENNS